MSDCFGKMWATGCPRFSKRGVAPSPRETIGFQEAGVNRRSFLSLLAMPLATARGQERATSGQGMASRGIAAAPRPKPSG
jgi:hypothetical protein